MATLARSIVNLSVRAVRSLRDSGQRPISREVARRTRILTIATLGLFLIGIPTIFQNLYFGVPIVSYAILVTMLAALGNLALLRWSRRPILCGHIGVGILTSILVVSNSVSGGFYDPNFGWLYTLPLVAAVAVDLRGAWIWAGVTLLITFGFWGLEGAGVAVPNLVPESVRHAQGLFTRATAILGLSIIATSFVTGQRRGERDLAEANEDLMREAAYVQMLQFAAVSSNEATSLEDAMRESVLRICAAMDWVGGHAYLLDDDGILIPSSIWWMDDSDRAGRLRDLMQSRFRAGEGLPGRALSSGRPESVHDIHLDSEAPRARQAAELGLRAAWAVPVLVHGDVVGVLEFCSMRETSADPRLLEVLAHIGVQIGRVAERSSLEDRLRQSQKMEAVGQLAAGIAHEINNPMSYVRTNLNVLMEDWADLRKQVETTESKPGLGRRFDECQELIEECLEGADRTITIVRDMKDFSRAEARWEMTSVEDLIDGAQRVAAPRAGSGVCFERDYQETPRIRCTPNPLRQVFLNLIVNAIQEIGDRGSIRLGTRLSGRHVVVQVEDDGRGIESAERERLFDPFFTTKPVGEGTGLGLYVSYEIVENHGGEIRVSNGASGGALFEVVLPIEGPSSEEATPS